MKFPIGMMVNTIAAIAVAKVLRLNDLTMEANPGRLALLTDASAERFVTYRETFVTFAGVDGVDEVSSFLFVSRNTVCCFVEIGTIGRFRGLLLSLGKLLIELFGI
jgi:hypothetical protein